MTIAVNHLEKFQALVDAVLPLLEPLETSPRAEFKVLIKPQDVQVYVMGKSGYNRRLFEACLAPDYWQTDDTIFIRFLDGQWVGDEGWVSYKPARVSDCVPKIQAGYEAFVELISGHPTA